MFEQLGPGLKMGMEIEVWSENECGKYIFWSEIGSGFGELGAHPHQEFPGVTPPPPTLSCTTAHEVCHVCTCTVRASV